MKTTSRETQRQPKVYDKAKYHLDSKSFPRRLSRHQAFVHTGFFLGWVIESGMLASEIREAFRDVLERFLRHEITGPQVYSLLGGVFSSDMLTEEGRHFADAYFDFQRGDYIQDYVALLAEDLPSEFHVEDTWTNYEAMKKKIQSRFRSWKRRARP